MVRNGSQQLIKWFLLSAVFSLSVVFSSVTYCGRPSLRIVQIFKALYNFSGIVGDVGAINLVDQIFIGAKSVYQKHPRIDHLSIMNNNTFDNHLCSYSFVPLFGVSKIL